MTYSSSWERFVETESVNGVRLPIAASWARSAESNPLEPSIEVHSEPDRDDVLLRAARGVLDGVEEALSNTTTWVSLADSKGIVIYEWSSTSSLRHRLDNASVAKGALLEEHAVGTNGVGLALATRSPSRVNGAEHLNPAWHDLVCVAAPLIHPLSREVIGIANITALVAEENQHVKIALNSLTSGIQDSFASGLRTRHQRLLDAHLRVTRATPLMVITLDGQTMIAENSRELAGFDRDMIWSLIERTGASATQLTLPSGQRVRLFPIDQTDISAGCSLVFGAPIGSHTDRVRMHDAKWRSLGPIEQSERDVIISVLREVEGNKSIAADRLQISRGTLYERLRRYGLEEV
ncbi:hypothetical protein KPL76_03130 [Subtercola sp. PAMC28395]|uniref:helix-turn-helix domain-containing protein n=1 Tax=Subtercola sp. PAMC28395 TaxID=2846775 RepID=UPI001C0E828E|nr:helix-turn-helix domain-containing protein [Subtercola sp. PAMC28395]QWT24412.1 hypothetical protein KPL76_03130 [Subtercola sp. PAMC28395]